MRRKLYFCRVPVAIISLFSLLFIASCQKSWDEVVEPVAGIDRETVIASVRGMVVNENNIPVESAVVQAGGISTTTDRYGVFRIDNVVLSKNNGFVKVKKEGYFNGGRSFVSVSGRTQNVRIRLLPKTNTGSFSASSGGIVSLSSGAKVAIPASAIADAAGNSYTGTVNVAMTWIDPVSPDLPGMVPGDLRGITAGGAEMGLQTFGMIGVELTNSNGQELKIAEGKTAELIFPVPASIAAIAPAMIDLWHFDEMTGRWKQEGQAVKNGNNYTAKVSHFSFWNCDAPFPVVNFCATLVESVSGEPLNNVQLIIRRTVVTAFSSGRTDSAGHVCGKIPQNEPLILEVLDQCNNVVSSQPVGPFSNDADLGNLPVIIPAVNMITLTGTVTNCSNAIVSRGLVEIYTGGGNSYIASVTNGNFSLTILNCGSSASYSILPVDYTTLQQGTPVTGTAVSGTINTGTIQACGTSVEEFIELLVDGIPVSFTSPPDQIGVTDSSQTSTTGTISNMFDVYGSSTANATKYILMSFKNTGTTGAVVMELLHILLPAGVFSPGPVSSMNIVSPAPVVNVTSLGPPVTGFIEGNFNVQMSFSGITKNISCTFRVRRI